MREVGIRSCVVACAVIATGALALGCDSEPAGPVCNIEPTLSSIQAEYLEPSCVFGDCHDSSAREGDLDLSATGAALHTQLVGVPTNDPNAFDRGKIRVVAGDPDASFLVQKLEGTMADDEGEMMPDGVTEPLGPDCQIAMIRQWIAEGAEDN